MSGGHFDYYQYHINEIAEQLERNIADIEYGKSVGKVKKQELCAHLVDVDSGRKSWPFWLFELCRRHVYVDDLKYALKKWYKCYEKDGKIYVEDADEPGVFEVVISMDETEVWADGDSHLEVKDSEVLEEFKKGLEILKKAAIYTQRIDWLLSGDDGEDSFKRRLKEELDELESKPLIDYERWNELFKEHDDE
jgi:hypothetical protein